MKQAVFLIRTDDRQGLLAAISNFFTGHKYNIIGCRQYTDLHEGRYFMRVVIDLSNECTRRELEEHFSALARELRLTYEIHYSDEVRNVAVMVTKTSHCLYDLLMHSEENTLGGGRVVMVVGNHPELESVADRFRVPFYCFPVEKGKEAEQEALLHPLFERNHIDLIVLARYMRILSDDFISRYPRRIINIHHGFLPAFQGSDPYRQAWERGVKIIGATAHYATAELDEGPIIEQDVVRISHEDTPEALREIGRDIERRVLTRAVQAHLEHRIILSDRRTIVFGR
ncbi:MAG: formyltetrahydrofolate deformylase [Victivallaceae bacterium]|nr:formyltetrahydrofolate deformylase [Victivallaceae bacterium]